MDNGFSIRNTEVDDYKQFCEWWSWFRFPAPPLDMLPNNGNDGIVVIHNNIDVCAGFLYATSSPSLFWCEYIVSNPEIKDRIIRKEALKLLIETISKLAKQMGGKIIFTSLKNESLVKSYESCGYVIGSTNTTEMIKNLI